MKKEKKTTLIISVIIFVIMIGLIFNAIVSENNLVKSGTVGSAIVYETSLTYRGNLILKYKFKIGDQDYLGETSFPNIQTSKQQYFLNKNFPAIYLGTNPSNNELLVTKEDFLKFMLPFPDGLAWVEQYRSEY